MLKNIIKPLVLSFLILFSLTELNAQGRSNQAPGRSGQAPGHNKPNKPIGVPIDGGAGILLAAGAAYGLKKLRDYRVNSRKDNQGI